MKAVFYYGAGELRLEEIPDPSVSEGLVLLKVLACGICGGDYKMTLKAPDAVPGVEGIIPGHEIVGEVIESPTDLLKAGTRIAVSPNYSCGICDYCRSGFVYLCENRPKRTAAIGGGYAEYCVIHPSQCYALPDDLGSLEASIAETLACCLHGAAKVNIQAGDRVMIIGAGANAQLFVQIARMQGASFVIVVDNLKDRMGLALELGADMAVNADGEDPLMASPMLKYGADVIIVNRGRAEAVTHAVNWCSSGGRVLCYGVALPGFSASIEPHILWAKEVSVVGSRSYGTSFGTALSLIRAGRIKVSPIITRTVNLEGVIDALSSPQSSIKTVILP